MTNWHVLLKTSFLLFCACCVTISVQDNEYASTADLSEKFIRYEEVPTVYKKWWKEMSDCAGIRGNIKRIHWYKVGDDSTENFICLGTIPCTGLWRPKHQIYVVGSHVLDRRTVMHEMLHDLLGIRNKNDHDHHELFGICLNKLAPK